MEATLIHTNNQPFFRINGVDYPPVALMSYNPQAERDERFRQNGMKLFTFSVFFGDRGVNPGCGLKPFSENFWKGYGVYDFSSVDRLFEMAAPGGKGAFLFPRVFVDAPVWWHEANPGELHISSSGVGMLQSFASEKWRADVKVVLEALMDHIRESKWSECVFGLQPAFGGTEESVYQNLCHNTFGDFSVHSLNQYRAWLCAKYGTVENLQKSWAHTAAVQQIHDFNDVKLPRMAELLRSQGGVLRDTKREAHVIDFLQYHNYLIADTLIYLCKCVKDYTGHHYITGGFYGYLMYYPHMWSGHNDCYDVYNSPYIDFISSAGSGTMSRIASSLRLHNKMFFSEGDIRTDQSTCMSETMPDVLPPYNSRYSNESIWKLKDGTPETGLWAVRAGAVSALTRHAGIWFFDMFGGWFDAPEKMREIALLEGWMKRQADSEAIQLKARVAVMIDETGPFCYGGVNCGEVLTALSEFPAMLDRMGAPYDIYLADDLAEAAFDPDEYDLYIMLCCVEPSERVRAGIQRLKGGNRTLLWMHMAGLQDSRVSDFTVTYDRTQPRIRCRPLNTTSYTVSEDFPTSPARCGRFSEADIGEAYPLAMGIEEGSDIPTPEPAILLKPFASYTSVYCLTPSMSSKMLHDILVMAGVFTYCYPGDCVFAGGCFVAIKSPNGGEKQIALPHRIHHAYDAVTGEEWVTNEKMNIPLVLKPGETRLFYLE